MTEHDAPVDAVLAVDIAPTQFGVALVSPRGLLIDRAAAIVPPADGPESLFATLVELIEEMLAEAAARHHVHVHVRGVGVACAGPVERDLENVSPLGLSWQRYPLRSRLVELTGLPVFGDLDARGLALAEGWRGAAQGHPNFCSITISNTIGGGVVLMRLTSELDSLVSGGRFGTSRRRERLLRKGPRLVEIAADYGFPALAAALAAACAQMRDERVELELSFTSGLIPPESSTKRIEARFGRLVRHTLRRARQLSGGESADDTPAG